MTDIKRTGEATWKGNLREGNGQISTASGVLDATAYDFHTRFEQAPGTNPEELIAAAHAACYSMAFSNVLAEQGYEPQQIQTRAVCSLTPLEEGGFAITKMRLEVRGQVQGIDEATFKRVAQEADQGCPVSNLLRPGLEIEHDVALM